METMDSKEFRRRAHEMVDWIADYIDNVEQYPVRSQVQPREVINKLPQSPPEQGESFDTVFKDFQDIILPGITHWQHPLFCAYFNANNSYPSMLGEMLMSALGAQCMSWQTSPAATELEERVMEWTRQLLGLPEDFTGVIQDTASTATLCSLLGAREKHSSFAVNKEGLYNQKKFIIYCSSEAHSSIEKDVKILGLGKENIRKVPVDEHFAMIPEKLFHAVGEDRRRGFYPLAVVVAFGTTGSTAIDPLEPIGRFCREQDIWLHVDAAYAGTALVLPEKRELINGLQYADTFVFNPHKWMFTNFDCSAYFVRDEAMLVRSLEILPEYLKTKEGDRVNNYRDWGIQLGRRFRALKLWFVLRTYGVQGLRDKIGEHIQWARDLAETIQADPQFQLLAPAPFATLCFRYKPIGMNDPEELNQINAKLMETLNQTGKIYLSHTKLNGVYTIRLVIGQTYQQQHHIHRAWEMIKTTASQMLQ